MRKVRTRVSEVEMAGTFEDEWLIVEMIFMSVGV